MQADRVAAVSLGDSEHKAPRGVDLFQRLRLDDPATKTVYDLYSGASGTSNQTVHDKQVDAMLAKFGVDDPAKFDKAVHGLYERASAEHLPLNMDTLDKFSHDNKLSGAERTTAQTLHDDFRPFAFAAGEPFGGMFTPSSHLAINGADVADIDDKAKLLETARQHPELHNPQLFAAEARTLLPQGRPLMPEDPQYLVDSKSLSYLQRVTAMALVGGNYDKILAVRRDTYTIDSRILDNVATIGRAKPAGWLEKCISADSIPVLATTAEAAVAGGALGHAMGGKADRSAIMAAGMTAAIASVHNANVESGCRKEYEATR